MTKYMDSGGLSHFMGLVKADIPFIEQNNATASDTFTADAPFASLSDGQRIFFWRKYNWQSSGYTNTTNYWSQNGCALNLTLPDGTTTGAIPIFYNSTSRLTSHYQGQTCIMMIYRENVVAPGYADTHKVAQAWYCVADYNSDNVYSRSISNGFYCGANGILSYGLCMKDANGRWTAIVNNKYSNSTQDKTCYTGGLELGEVLYAASWYSNGRIVGDNQSISGDFYASNIFDFRFCTNISANSAAGKALTVRQPVYLVGTVDSDDGLYYLDTTQWWTQTPNQTGKVYIYLGIAYSWYQLCLVDRKDAYIYDGSKLVEYHVGKFEGSLSGNATNVTGTVAIANGGTGQTTAANAANAIFGGLPAWTADPTDNTYFPRQDTAGGASYGKAKFSTLWNYIKGKISSWTKNNTSRGNLGWSSSTNDVMPITSNTLAYWDGAYQGTSSNLEYTAKGKLGTAEFLDGIEAVSLGRGTAIPANSDLNTYFTLGNYHCALDSTAATLGHCPSLNAFTMQVRYSTGGGYPMQVLVRYTDGHTWVRRNGYSPTESGWTDWVERYDSSAGTVSVARGGTGQTTAQAAANALIGALDNSAAQSTDYTDNTSIITTNVNGTTGTYYHRKASLLWNYIKGKISSVLGLTATNYGGTAAKATADASGNNIASTYANQNAFSNVKVGSTTVAADTTTDTLELAGSNVTITPDATNDKVTIGITASNVTTALGNTAVNRATADASGNNIANTYTKTSYGYYDGYVRTQPENSPVIVPFINNDIAFLLKRGGSAVVKYDGAVQNVDISSAFDGSPTYWAITYTGTTEIVIELTLHKVFTWTNKLYLDFGPWYTKTIKVEVMYSGTGHPNDTWTSKLDTTTNTSGFVVANVTHTPVGASNAGGGFNKVRLTFSFANGAYSSTMFRIAQIGILNYASAGLRETYMSRGINDSVFRDITPATTNAYNLGSSTLKWSNIYATKFNGPSTGVIDANNGTSTITLQYSSSGISSAQWFPAFDGYNIKPMSDLYLRRTLLGTRTYTAIAASTDLNTLTTAGYYKCQNSTTAASLVNCPTDQWFVMTVYYADGNSSTYMAQEVIRGGDGARFYRQQNGGTWTAWYDYSAKASDKVSKSGDTMTGALTATSITASSGYLKSTLNGNTVTIGSANSGYCHISNSANIPFWFNKSILVENGKGLGGTGGNYGLAFLEMNPADSTSNNGGYIDFHYNKSTSDYTTRLVEDASGQLSVIGNLRLGSNSQSSVANAGIRVNDVRSTTIANNAIDQAANFYFTNNGTPNSNWWGLLHVKGWTGGYSAWELAGPAHNGDMRTTPLYVRTGNASNTWGSWRKIFDDAQTVPVANGGTGATTAAAARTNLAVVGKTDEMLTTNYFAPASLKGPYISKIDNAFYAADKRWTVTKTGTTSGNGIDCLFDGSYETRMQIPVSTSVVINMDFTATTYFPGYPYGYILVSFYYDEQPESVSGRVYCNYQSQGIGWHAISFTRVSDSTGTQCVYRSEHQGYYNISQLEITVTAGSSKVAGVAQIEMHLDRPAPSRNPFLSKYNAETLYYNLTAPKFIGALQGNADTASTATDIASTNRKTVANYLLNALDTGSSDPVDNDYYISQYVNGGTTTTTYHRRPVSKLWNYIKSKISSWMKNNTSKGNLGWTSSTNDVMPITSNTLAYWDGSFNSSHNSNLTYCTKGEFGTMATKNSLAASDIPAHASTATTYGTGTDANYGHVKLSDSTSSSTAAASGGTAATPKAVKAAYDLANTANTAAGNAMSAATGGIVFKVTYSISGSSVVCAAHVYSAGSETTSSYNDSCFVWSMSLNGGTSWTSLGTGKTKTVSAMSTYGGNVKCDFTPPAS